MTQFLITIPTTEYKDKSAHDRELKSIIDAAMDFSHIKGTTSILQCNLFEVLQGVRPYVGDMVGIASNARLVIQDIDAILSLVKNYE